MDGRVRRRATGASLGPDSVSVTVYRVPHGRPGDELRLEWLDGYALVTEKRTITIPADRTIIRFEGVAGGILAESAIVTGLYRVPHRTTIAAMSQKQVGLLDREAVPFEAFYRLCLYGDRVSPVRRMLRAQNRIEAGLGLPLPAGKVTVFQPIGGTTALIGAGLVGDKVVGEEVEVEILEAPEVTAEMKAGRGGKGWRDQVLTVSNDNSFATRLELEVIRSDDYRIANPSAKFGRAWPRSLSRGDFGERQREP